MTIPFTTPFLTPAERPPTAAGRFAATIRPLADASANETPAKIALLGLADDAGVAMNRGRPGAREGPRAFRAALARYGVAEPMGQAPLPAVVDAGDVIPGETLAQTHDRVSAAAAAIVERGVFPVAIGGGHDLTFPFVRGVASRAARPVTAGLYVDPHLDVRAEPGSGMPFRALVEHAGVKTLVNVGAEPLVNSREHGEWFLAHGGRLAPSGIDADEALAGVQFVSLDLDALDAAYAPGVSALNPCGLPPARLAAFARAAGRSAARGELACFDVMELNPLHDLDGRTARVAAYLFLSFLAGFAEATP